MFYLLERWVDSGRDVRAEPGTGPVGRGQGLWLCGAKPFGGYRKPLSLLEPKGNEAKMGGGGGRERRNQRHMMVAIVTHSIMLTEGL